MQPKAFGSIKPAQLARWLLILFRSGQNSGWKTVSCGVHMYRLEQKIRMGSRASCNNQLRTEGESKREVTTLSQSSPATVALRTPLLQVQRGGLGGSVFLLLLFHQQLAVPSVVGVSYEHIKKIFLVYTTKKNCITDRM